MINNHTFFELDLKKALHSDASDRVSFGMERSLFKLMKLRGGLSQNIKAVNTNRHYALGLGLFYKHKPMNAKFAIDFAYLITELENFYHVGLKFSRLK